MLPISGFRETANYKLSMLTALVLIYLSRDLDQDAVVTFSIFGSAATCLTIKGSGIP